MAAAIVSSDHAFQNIFCDGHRSISPNVLKAKMLKQES